MPSSDALYLGLDLSTQQLKAIIIDAQLTVHHEAKVDFDADLPRHGTRKGVLVNESERQVFAPVVLWLEALDLLLTRLHEQGAALADIRAISGAGQQHGSVYWARETEQLLENLEPGQTLAGQLGDTFAHPLSPNWQDASTQTECDAFDDVLGGGAQLAQATGSKAHHRFTGPQIMRFKRLHADVYAKTSRISLVSSFLASLFLGRVAPLDMSDVCGMNLWNIPSAAWDERLLALAGGDDVAGLKRRLGEVAHDSGSNLGLISTYYVHRYGVSETCIVTPFTGDNPATILSLPLRANDAIVSLGTSTTFLMSTPTYLPDPRYHFFNHPTTAGLYMFMLCYKNGALARERVRDALAATSSSDDWQSFNKVALTTPILGQTSPSDPPRLALYFPLPEIVPNVHAGTWRFHNHNHSSSAIPDLVAANWDSAGDARAILESQILSLRLRSSGLLQGDSTNERGLPPQPRRIYLVGGGSMNLAIARVIGDVLGGSEGVWKLDVGSNACALGGAYKALWAAERSAGETFEALIGQRWQQKEAEAVVKIDDGYRRGIWERYGDVLGAFAAMETVVANM